MLIDSTAVTDSKLFFSGTYNKAVKACKKQLDQSITVDSAETDFDKPRSRKKPSRFIDSRSDSAKEESEDDRGLLSKTPPKKKKTSKSKKFESSDSGSNDEEQEDADLRQQVKDLQKSMKSG